MNISITFKNMESSEHVKSHVNDKFSRLDKMFDSPAEMELVLSTEKLRNIAEIRMNGDKIKIHAKEESEKNMYAAIDALYDKVKIQIKKYKDKQSRHLAGDKQSIKTEMEQMAEEEDS